MRSLRIELFKNSLIISFLPIFLLITFFSLTCYQIIKKHINGELKQQLFIFSEFASKNFKKESEEEIIKEIYKFKELFQHEIYYIDCKKDWYTTEKYIDKETENFWKELKEYLIPEQKPLILKGPNKDKFLILKTKNKDCYQIIGFRYSPGEGTLYILRHLFGLWFFLGILITLFSFIYAIYLSYYFSISIKDILKGLKQFQEEGREPQIEKIEIKELEEVRQAIIKMAKDTIKHQDEICETMSLFKAILNSTKSMIFMIDKTTKKICLTNKEALINLAYNPQEIINKKIDEIMKKNNNIVHFKKKDGKDIPCLISETETILNKKPVIILTAQDISKIINLQKKISEEKAKLAAILESINEGVIATDDTGKIIFINKKVEEIIEEKEINIINKKINDVIKIDRPINLQNSIKMICDQKNYLHIKTAQLITKNKIKYICCYISPIIDKNSELFGVLLTIRDITREKELEKELRKQEKLKSLGIMAGGIAHDFNNYLQAMNNNLEILKNILSKEKEIKKYLARIEFAIKQAQDLTQQLLIFAKGKPRKKKLIAIKELITETAYFAVHDKETELHIKCPDNLWPIEADEGQIKQVIQNLIINASEAMENKGKIEITCRNISKEEAKMLDLEEKEFVEIKIKDYGYGIPEEIQTKIFDPFFTTKENGNGLGLAITYSVITSHKGKILLTSKKNHGTTFIIYLPAKSKTEKAIKENRYLESQNNEKYRKINGSKNILIMDDDHLLGETTKEILESMGHKAEHVKNGEEALKKFKEALKSGKPFDLVILDINIKNGWDGLETFKHLRKIDPEIKVIFTSGRKTEIPLDQNTSFLQKPYDITELKSAIERLTNEPPALLAEA